MIKNKDGSYNKVSMIILSLIALIGLGLFISTIVTEPIVIPNIDLSLPLYIIGIITLAFLGYKLLFRKTPSTQEPKILTTTTNTKSQEDKIYEIKEIQEKLLETKKQVTQKRSSISMGAIITAVISLIMISVVIFISGTVMNSISQATPQLPANSPWSSTTENLQSTMSSAFNIIGLFFPIMGLIFVVSMLMGLLKSS